MSVSRYGFGRCSKGSSMLQPIDMPPASRAPLLAASMIPGPPPVMIAKPARACRRATSSAMRYCGSSGATRAEPKTVTALSRDARRSKPSTNSATIRMTRHGSVWVNSALGGRGRKLRSCSSSVTRGMSTSRMASSSAGRWRDRAGPGGGVRVLRGAMGRVARRRFSGDAAAKRVASHQNRLPNRPGPG